MQDDVRQERAGLPWHARDAKEREREIDTSERGLGSVVAVALALALAFEPGEPRLMQRPPRRRDSPADAG